MTTISDLIIENRGRVRYLILNRPNKRNALNYEIKRDLQAAVVEAATDDSVGAIVIRGNGKSFCAGGDITPDPNAVSDYDIDIRVDIQRMQRTSGNWGVLWKGKAVIAQIHGHCIGEGTELALNCDVIIAADDVRIGYPPVRALGSPPTHMWTYHVGPQWAKLMLLTGDTIDGKTAERIGLVAKSVPADQLDSVVDAIAQRMALVPNDLQAANKSICNKALDLMGRQLLQQLALETDAIAHKSLAVKEFYERSNKDGLKSALDWRDGIFAETKHDGD
jgi:enoyl-CoA hydratase